MEEKQWKQWLTLFFWAPKSLQMVIAAMKLKDAYSLEGKLWPTSVQFSSFQSLSRVRLYDSMNCSMSGLSVHHQLPEFTLTHVHWVSNAIQPSHPLLSPSPPAFNLSQIRVFPNDSVLYIRWTKYWSFSFNISASSEYSGLISFRMDWLDLLTVQGTLKSLLQYHSSKASIIPHSAFFIVTSIHDHWKNHSLD